MKSGRRGEQEEQKGELEEVRAQVEEKMKILNGSTHQKIAPTETKQKRLPKLKRKGHDVKDDVDADESLIKSNSENSLYSLPLLRVSRIIKSEAVDFRIAHDSIFLISKAAEMFLESFCEDVYSYTLKDHKNFVAYRHLSSAVSKQRRLDFLSDSVPEKVKAKDA